MSVVDVAIILVLGIALGIVSLGGYARLVMRRKDSQAKRAAQDRLDERVASAEGPVHLTDDDVSLEELEARVVDPENPPAWRVYSPRTAGRLVICTCHGFPIQPGDSVLMWPIKDHPDGAMDIFCERTVKRP